MKKCSYCGRDNADEALNCHECGTEFETAPNAKLSESFADEPVVICTYGQYESAQIAAASLESKGIHSWITSDDCGGMLPIVGSGVRLLVHANYVDEARKVLLSQDQSPSSSDKEIIVRDLPKPVIVAGIWLLYGTGLVSNIILFIFCLNGTFVGIQGFVYFWFSIGCGSLCIYLLYRVIKNYQIQKRRMEAEKGAD